MSAISAKLKQDAVVSLKINKTSISLLEEFKLSHLQGRDFEAVDDVSAMERKICRRTLCGRKKLSCFESRNNFGAVAVCCGKRSQESWL